MSAERMPQTEPSLLAIPLGWLTRLVVRFPIATLILAATGVLVALALGGSRLGFRTSRLDLLNPKSSYNRLWLDFIEEFGDEDDVVVVVEGPNPEHVVPALDDIAAALRREDRLFHAVLYQGDLLESREKISSKGLHYLDPDELGKIEQFVEEVQPIVRGDWARLNLGNSFCGTCALLQQTESEPAERMVAAELSRLSGELLVALGQAPGDRSSWPAMPDPSASFDGMEGNNLLTERGRLGFVLLRLAKDGEESFAQGTEAIDSLRRLIDRVQAQHSATTIGLTGLPVMENDEMRGSQVSMMEASLLSLFGVACLFIAGFGGLRHPLMTVAAMLIGMAWSLGYITLAVGHLNILSISFGVILIGLGIDFGVHYAARYLQLHRQKRLSDEALVETARSVGPGIVTGGLTTSIAFFAAGLTEFTGVAELGIIAGGGILLCLLAALTVLPAMIRLSDARRPNVILPAPLDVHGWMRPVFTRPKALLAVTLLGTLLVSFGMVRLRYDHNLLNLQPEGLESVELERKLLEDSDRSVWYAVSVADSREELLRRKEQFEQLPSVERVDEIVRFLPDNKQQKLPIIQRIHQLVAELPEQPPWIPIDSPADLGQALARAKEFLGEDPQTAQAQHQLEQLGRVLGEMPLNEFYRRLSDYQQRMAGELLGRLHALRAVANPEPPVLGDLPEGLLTRFVGHNGRQLLKVYSAGNIWDMEAMERFVADVAKVDPHATGNPIQTYYASRQMKRSYEQAAWYAFAAVLLVLFIDFSSLRYTLLAMTPMVVGMAQLFGLLGLLDVPLNPANMIVLPLILGIGVDDGVHVVHDFRLQKGRYRMSPSTASAVLITSLTTMVGFGSLMIASHQGLQSLGRVLTIGVSCCLFTSLVMLPATLTWATRNRSHPEEDRAAGSDSPSSSGSSSRQRIYHRIRAQRPAQEDRSDGPIAA